MEFFFPSPHFQYVSAFKSEVSLLEAAYIYIYIYILFSLLKIYLLFIVFILAVPGLSCGMQDLFSCGMQAS